MHAACSKFSNSRSDVYSVVCRSRWCRFSVFDYMADIWLFI